MTRPGEDTTEFWFEQAASETPVMRGPGIAVAFSRGRGLVHALQIQAGSSAAAIELTPWLIQATSTQEQNGARSDGRRIDNPLFQELVPHELALEQRPGICALLTGSCFEHHFSAVFSLSREQDELERIVFDIDIADRCRRPVEALAATYIVSCADAEIEPKSSTANSLVWGIGAGDLELVAPSPATILASPTSEGLRVQVQARIDPANHTHRLHYRWRWASRPDFTR